MKQMIDESEKYLVHSYNRYPVVLDHGDGVKLYDTDGSRYIWILVPELPFVHWAMEIRNTQMLFESTD